ncbi:MAG: sulfotransferase [Verrucomicrobia bacterium]|nr:sulfotransferase [Verrucomicrobiota bacterium]
MPRLAYLLAASHSGSTLLAMLLGAQPGACTAGELKATHMGDAASYRCSCRERILDCYFWKQVGAAMASRGYPEFDITSAGTCILETESPYVRRLLAPLYRGGGLEMLRDLALSFSPAWRARLAGSIGRNLALIESLLEVTGAGVVIDSSKVALRLKYLLRVPDLDLRVIRMIRDGRAVSLTYINEWNFADSSDPSMRSGGTGIRRPPQRNSMAEAANSWKRSNEASDVLTARLPASQWTEVRYEELCADPAGTLRRLATFLDLDPDQVTLDFRSRTQHVIGNGMRMDATSEIRLDKRWKTHLGKADLDIFDGVAGDLNRRYGYI